MEGLLWNWFLAFATVLSVALLLLSIGAYRRNRSLRFLLVTGAFAFFALKGVALSLGVNVIGSSPVLFLAAQGVDVAILGLFYLGVQS